MITFSELGPKRVLLMRKTCTSLICCDNSQINILLLTSCPYLLAAFADAWRAIHLGVEVCKRALALHTGPDCFSIGLAVGVKQLLSRIGLLAIAERVHSHGILHKSSMAVKACSKETYALNVQSCTSIVRIRDSSLGFGMSLDLVSRPGLRSQTSLHDAVHPTAMPWRCTAQAPDSLLPATGCK